MLARAFAVVLLLLPLSALADPNPMGLRPHKFNGSARPVTQDGVTTFVIRSRECSNVKYGDGRGETDCKNGNVRSSLSGYDVKVPGAYVYEFDIRADPLTYPGYYNSHAYGYLTGTRDSRLRIVSWEGNLLHNFVYMLKLDATRGITFLDEVCAAPADMGDWMHFRMEVNWRNDDRGWIRVTCNGRVVQFLEGVKTTDNPHCYVTNQCEKGVPKSPRRITFILGPVMSGFGYEWKKYGKPSQFTDFDGEIRVQVRGVRVSRGAVLYDAATTDAVRQLQARLHEIGCDPGPVDGAMGAKTRSAVRTCRSFAEGAVPDRVDASTVAAWLAAYRAVPG